jgi:hypothetical protein
MKAIGFLESMSNLTKYARGSFFEMCGVNGPVFKMIDFYSQPLTHENILKYFVVDFLEFPSGEEDETYYLFPNGVIQIANEQMYVDYHSGDTRIESIYNEPKTIEEFYVFCTHSFIELTFTEVARKEQGY